MLNEYFNLKPKSSKTNIGEALSFLRNTQKKRAICFVISDFIDDNNFIEGLKITKKKHDVIALKLEDPSEYELPKMGYVQLYNAETGETTWVNTNDPQTRNEFKQNYIDQRDKIAKGFTKNGIDYAVLNTGENNFIPLVNLFKNR